MSNPSHEDWIETEGGIEHPTHIETLMKPEQQARIQWLKGHCYMVYEVLDIGCNWGYVLNEIGGMTGVDKNIENIDKGMREFPHLHFVQGDITEGLPFDDNQYAIVVLADVLEHIEFWRVPQSLKEAMRIARHKLLITLPWKQIEDCAGCFKHAWVPSVGYLGVAINILMGLGRKTSIECDDYFVYMEVWK